MLAITTRYHTKGNADTEIRSPKTPVKPQIRTVKCNNTMLRDPKNLVMIINTNKNLLFRCLDHQVDAQDQESDIGNQDRNQRIQASFERKHGRKTLEDNVHTAQPDTNP